MTIQNSAKVNSSNAGYAASFTKSAQSRALTKGKIAGVAPQLYSARENTEAKNILRNDIPGGQNAEWRKNCAGYANEELLACISNFAGIIEKENPADNKNYSAVAVSFSQNKLKAVFEELKNRIKIDPFKFLNELNGRGRLSALVENILKLHNLKKLFPKDLQGFYQNTVIDKSNEFVSEFVLSAQNAINGKYQELTGRRRGREEENYAYEIKKLGQDYGLLIGAIYSATINNIAPKSKITVLWASVAENVTLEVDAAASYSDKTLFSRPQKMEAGAPSKTRSSVRIDSKTNVMGLLAAIQNGMKNLEFDEKLKTFCADKPFVNIKGIFGDDKKIFMEEVMSSLDNYLKPFYHVDYAGIVKITAKK